VRYLGKYFLWTLLVVVGFGSANLFGKGTAGAVISNIPDRLHHQALSVSKWISGFDKTTADKAKLIPSRAVRVTRVHYAAVRKTRHFTGSIQARYELKLSFRVGGKIKSRLVETGERVKAGQTIAILDETDLRLSFEAAEAEVRSWQAQLANASIDEKRADKLARKGYTSKAKHDRNQTRKKTTSAGLEAAKRRLEIARNRLGYTTLKAYRDGVVTKLHVEEGQVVTPGTTIVTIIRPKEQEAVVSIPENFVQHLNSTKAYLTLWANPGKIFKARLRELSPVADPLTRTYQARFSLPDIAEHASLGMTATVHLIDGREKKLAIVPSTALFDRKDGRFVWMVTPNQKNFRLRRVTVASIDQQVAYLTGGVEEGNLIVVEGVHRIHKTLRPEIGEILPQPDDKRS